jgi:hypothetical protein
MQAQQQQQQHQQQQHQHQQQHTQSEQQAGKQALQLMAITEDPWGSYLVDPHTLEMVKQVGGWVIWAATQQRDVRRVGCGAAHMHGPHPLRSVYRPTLSAAPTPMQPTQPTQPTQPMQPTHPRPPPPQVHFPDRLRAIMSCPHPAVLSDGSLLSFSRAFPWGGTRLFRQDRVTLQRTEVRGRGCRWLRGCTGWLTHVGSQPRLCVCAPPPGADAAERAAATTPAGAHTHTHTHTHTHRSRSSLTATRCCQAGCMTSRAQTCTPCCWSSPCTWWVRMWRCMSKACTAGAALTACLHALQPRSVPVCAPLLTPRQHHAAIGIRAHARTNSYHTTRAPELCGPVPGAGP